MSLARSIGRNAALHGVGIMAQRLAGFVMLPLYTRRLSQADYGTIGLIDFTVGLVALIVGLNLADSLVRIYHDFDDERAKNAAISTTVIVNGCLALLAALLLSFASGSLGSIIFGAPVSPRLVTLAAATMALDAFAAPCFIFLRILDRTELFVGVSLSRLAIAVGTNVVWLGLLDGGITAYFASGVIAAAIQAAFLVAWTFRRVPFALSREPLERLLAFSLPLVPASVCSLALHQSSRYFLGRFGALEVLGVFSVAYQLGNVVSSGVITPFNLVWGTKVYEVLKEKDGRASVARVFLWFSLFLTWAAVGLSLLSVPLLSVYVGPRFTAASRAVPLVALGYVLFGLGFVVHVGVLVAKRTELSLRAAAWAAVVAIVLNVLAAGLAPYELLDLAPAATTALAFAVLAGLRYRYAQQLYPIPYDWKRAAAFLVLGAGCVVLPFLASLSPGADLVARLFLAFAYPLLAVLVVPAEERSAALELIRETWRSRIAGTHVAIA